ncbi:MAG: polysaccharide deacetylase family protein [Deltaproteobacteria bacterium]
MIVLMYHRVNDALEPGEWVVPVARFQEQMEYLRQRHRVVGPEALFPGSRSVVPGPRENRDHERPVLLTFDDGYRDNYLNAYPFLKEFRLQATIFLTTGYIGTDHKRPRYKDVPWRRDYLDRGEIREMRSNGIGFGAHTATHPHLLGLDDKTIEAEVGSSRDFVAGELGMEKPAFSYPYGEFDDRIRRIVRESGFSSAYTVKPGVFHPGDDLFDIPRIGVSGTDTLDDFRKKLSWR